VQGLGGHERGGLGSSSARAADNHLAQQDRDQDQDQDDGDFGGDDTDA